MCIILGKVLSKVIAKVFGGNMGMVQLVGFLWGKARPSHMSDNSYISLVPQMLRPEISDHGDWFHAICSWVGEKCLSSKGDVLMLFTEAVCPRYQTIVFAKAQKVTTSLDLKKLANSGTSIFVTMF